MIKKLMRYGGCGLCATALHYLVFMGLLPFLGALSASVAGALLGALTAYTLNSRWTFPHNHNGRLRARRFVGVAILNNFLNFAFMWLGIHVVETNPFLAQVISTLIIFFLGFTLNSYWSYEKRYAV